MAKYDVDRWCCTNGHCSMCAGGGDMENRERVLQCIGVSFDSAMKAVRDFKDYKPTVHPVERAK